jgi:carbon-monoxide dehydrogenase medium subunit
VKPASFDYVRAASVGEAVEVLAADADAKVVAGGQSLTPLLALRLARPSVLVDMGRLPLAGVTVDGAALELGALVRHRVLETDPVVAREAPLLTLVAPHIGHVAIRNRGTIGGSVAHADPAAELPAALVALDAEVVVQGGDGVRPIRVAEMFAGYFSTTLAPDEVVTAVRVPRARRNDRFAFEEWAPRHGDFATAGVAVAASFDDAGMCTRVRAAALGVGAVPYVLSATVEAVGVAGATSATPTLARAVAAAVRATVTNEADSDEDRAELAGLLAARAVASLFLGERRAVA